MRLKIIAIFILTFSLILGYSSAVETEITVRDPFWPVNYQKPEPLVEKTAEVEVIEEQADESEEAKPPVILPVGEEEWEAVRKLVVEQGQIRARDPETGKLAARIMINRQTLTVGDTLTITNQAVCFIWQVVEQDNKKLALEKVSAERILNPENNNKTTP